MLTQASAFRLVTGVCSIGVIDYISGRAVAFTPACLPFPEGVLVSRASKPQLSNHGVSLRAVASRCLDFTQQRQLSGPAPITKTLHRSRNSKELEASSQEAGTKASRTVYYAVFIL